MALLQIIATAPVANESVAADFVAQVEAQYPDVVIRATYRVDDVGTDLRIIVPLAVEDELAVLKAVTLFRDSNPTLLVRACYEKNLDSKGRQDAAQAAEARDFAILSKDPAVKAALDTARVAWADRLDLEAAEIAVLQAQQDLDQMDNIKP